MNVPQRMGEIQNTGHKNNTFWWKRFHSTIKMSLGTAWNIGQNSGKYTRTGSRLYGRYFSTFIKSIVAHRIRQELRSKNKKAPNKSFVFYNRYWYLYIPIVADLWKHKLVVFLHFLLLMFYRRPIKVTNTFYGCEL